MCFSEASQQANQKQKHAMPHQTSVDEFHFDSLLTDLSFNQCVVVGPGCASLSMA
jgi:hypothetical protein